MGKQAIEDEIDAFNSMFFTETISAVESYLDFIEDNMDFCAPALARLYKNLARRSTLSLKV